MVTLVFLSVFVSLFALGAYVRLKDGYVCED